MQTICQCLAVILIFFFVNNSWAGDASPEVECERHGPEDTTADHKYPVAKDPMMTEWKVSKGDIITLPLREGFKYNFVVNWGDGTPQQLVRSYNDCNRQHRYSEAGTYQITLSGTLEAWSFIRGIIVSPPKIATQLLRVLNLGDMGWKDLSFAFAQCNNLTEVRGGNLSGVTDISYMFYFTYLANPDVRDWDVSSVEKMIGTFQFTHTANPDVSQWVTTSLIDSEGMFEFTRSANPDIRNWNLSSLKNRSRMFCYAEAINPNYLKAWNLSRSEHKEITCDHIPF